MFPSYVTKSVPGCYQKTLSSVCLRSHHLSQHETVPFTSDLETQHGTKITCLPFTINPFSLIDLAPNMSYDQSILDGSLRIHPRSIKVNLVRNFAVSCYYSHETVFSQMAAYPVLIPLYLAKYTYTVFDASYSVTAIVEAYCPEQVPPVLQQRAQPISTDSFCSSGPYHG